MATFSPSAAQEMQHYHRNKHVSPLLNPFGASCLWRKKKDEEDGDTQEELRQSWMKEEAKAFKVLLEGMSK